MPPTPATATRPRPHPRAARALARAWREASIPLGAGDTAAVPLLRAIARPILSGWKIPELLIEDVVLAASELATNALIHTRGPVRVRLSHRRGTVRLDVADTSTHHPAPADPGDEADHGRGLAIVTALANRVRTEPYPGNPAAGKLITAEFDVG
jgi:anti-sigma regulatory factor (Ser/Thr protein kinase)